MEEIIDSPKGKSWITRHNACSMLRQLFLGKIWDLNGKKLAIRQDASGIWKFGCIATKRNTTNDKIEDVLLNIDMTMNDFLGLMTNENILFEKLTKNI